MGGRLQLSILGVVTYVLVVAHTSNPTVPTALGVPYGYASAVTRVLGRTIVDAPRPDLEIIEIRNMKSITTKYGKSQSLTVSLIVAPHFMHGGIWAVGEVIEGHVVCMY